MSVIEFENGRKVEFDGDPTPEDIDFVAKELSITKRPDQTALQEEITTTGQEAERGIGSRFLEELPQETIRAFLKNPAKLVASGLFSPFDVGRQMLGRKPIAAELPLIGKTFQAEAEERLQKGASSLGTIGRAALEVPLAGAETIGLGKGISLAGKGVSAFRGRLSKTLQKTAPVLSSFKEQAAKEAGRVYKSFFGRVKIKPTPKDIEVGKTVQGLVNSRNPFKNILNLKQEIAKTDNLVGQGLQKNNVIFNQNQLQSKLLAAKEESRVVFGSDKALENTYNSVSDEFMRIVNKGDKNLRGLFEARKAFDRIIDKKFPRLFNDLVTDAPRTNAVLDIRRAANQFIADKLPAGNVYKALLHKENLMFEAIKNIAAKSPKLGTTPIGRLLKKPFVQAGLATGVVGSLIGGVTYRALRK